MAVAVYPTLALVVAARYEEVQLLFGSVALAYIPLQSLPPLCIEQLFGGKGKKGVAHQNLQKYTTAAMVNKRNPTAANLASVRSLSSTATT